ncbi:PREDICTED: uncharacterized protein At1g24485 [Tarenaya hassleriana]|uniref:uncharacterized protein At1g24485 n=1 Tax=Tarenaya hassleriana TaxID=28532 RepID=UPI00053C3949|nr:PREDICTED: uncharacterized protein At1g24485 [Tarenaya hassleriana]
MIRQFTTMAASTRLLLLLLVLLLSLSAISLADNISIDCGTTGSYVDDNNVTWVGDQGFITAGQTAKVPDSITDTVSKALTTLRYFPTGQSNCYSNVPVKTGGKILVRTTFYYSNYDGKFSSPTFDVVYAEKHRDTVTTSLIDGDYTFSEVIFVPDSGNISVCLVRTSQADNPFISAIEVVSLDAGMYSDLGTDEGFIVRQRFAYGAKGLISYPLDPYSRLWVAPPSNFLITELSTTAASIDTSTAKNKPPEIVMGTAWSADGLTLSDDTLPSAGIPVYLAMYFSETQNLGPNEKRSFNIYADDKQVGSGPVVPVFGKATQVVVRGVVLSSASQLVFRSTGDSTLPPLINALEYYSISGSQSGGGGGGGGSGTDGGAGQKGGSEGSSGTNKGSRAGGNNIVGGGSSNGPTKKKKNNAGLVAGVTLGSVFALLSALFGFFFVKKRKPTPRPQQPAVAVPVAGGGTGATPLVGQGGLQNGGNHPTNEVDMNDIEDLIGANYSYVANDDLRHPG